MTLEEIREATSRHLLPIIEEVDPSTASLAMNYLVVSGRAVMPLDGVSWSIDRSADLEIFDEHNAAIGTLCLVSHRKSISIANMTRWQYSAFLADCDYGAISGETHQFTRDYVVIDASELERYLEHYQAGSALWGGFHHGISATNYDGWRRNITARQNIRPPTSYHDRSFLLASQATNPQDQFLKLYHTVELLFDYVTFRKLIKSNEDLVGFSKIMQSHQRSELDRLKVIIKDYCENTNRLASKMVAMIPFVDRATDMFQTFGKDGNPLGKDGRWDKFCELARIGNIDLDNAKRVSLANNADNFDEFIANVAAYHIYRMRSSIAHSRIGEYVLSDDDTGLIIEFGIPLLEEVALQIFGGEAMSELMR